MTMVCDAQNHSVCDFIRNSAYGWMTKAVANAPHIMRPRFLQAAGMSLLTNAHLAPMHGALIARDGCGVLLCGDSFAGKSTLESQRMVYGAIAHLMKGDMAPVHAVDSLKTQIG